MKWFKHMTASSDDEKLAELMSDHGLEAYGFWWRLLEIVASRMEKDSDKCSAIYTLPHWSRLLYCHHNKVSKYMGKLGVMGIVTVRSVEGKTEVIIPNLLKYRDEYSRKSRQQQECVRPKNKIQIQIQRENIKEVVEHPPEALQLSGLLSKMILVNFPNNATAKKKDTIGRWASDIEKAHRIDGRAWADIEKILVWSQKDPFWKYNILSGSKLREKFDTLIAQQAKGGINGQSNFTGSATVGRKTGVVAPNEHGAKTDWFGDGETVQ